jgi:hypothetical protein
MVPCDRRGIVVRLDIRVQLLRLAPPLLIALCLRQVSHARQRVGMLRLRHVALVDVRKPEIVDRAQRQDRLRVPCLLLPAQCLQYISSASAILPWLSYRLPGWLIFIVPTEFCSCLCACRQMSFRVRNVYLARLLYHVVS